MGKRGTNCTIVGYTLEGYIYQEYAWDQSLEKLRLLRGEVLFEQPGDGDEGIVRAHDARCVALSIHPHRAGLRADVSHVHMVAILVDAVFTVQVDAYGGLPVPASVSNAFSAENIRSCMRKDCNSGHGHEQENAPKRPNACACARAHIHDHTSTVSPQ